MEHKGVTEQEERLLFGRSSPLLPIIPASKANKQLSSVKKELTTGVGTTKGYHTKSKSSVTVELSAASAQDIWRKLSLTAPCIYRRVFNAPAEVCVARVQCKVDHPTMAGMGVSLRAL